MQIGRYQILDKLGSGGMGEVYRALARGVDGFQKPVVIKRIHKHLADRPDLAAQFINEAKIAMDLLHGNVVQVLDLGKMGDEYYIALEYVDGRDVREVIRRCRELQEWIPQEISLYIIASVLGGLDYAHRRTDLEGRRLGIIHRDVTPANILCSFEGEVKLADFGIARALAQHSDTMPGGVKGSLRYMSPEQAMGRTVDQRSDIFSVGVNLYFLLCSAHPYGEDNIFAVAERVRAVRFDSPSERGVQLPEELESIILTAMAADPEDRYPTAAAMQTALEGYQRSVAHATSSDLRSFMQRIFDPESQRRSWSSPAADPLEAHDSLVGTEIEIGEERSAAPTVAAASERLRHALRVEGVVPKVPTRSDLAAAPLQASPTASDSATPRGLARSDLSASPHAETMLDLSSGSGGAPGSPAAVARISDAARISSSAPPVRGGNDAPASTAGEPSFREPSGRSATGTVHLGRTRGVILVVGVALSTAGLAIGGFYLATQRGQRSGGEPTADPVRPREPARTTGRLTLRSRPTGASVLLDGKPAGTAPVELQIELGREHRLELLAPGRERWSEPLRLEANAPTRTMLVELPPAAPPRPATLPSRKPTPPASAARGWVRVSTRPAWAEVHFQGRKIDVTPCRIQLPAGPQSLTLVNPALRKTARRRIVVRADREVELLITDFK